VVLYHSIFSFYSASIKFIGNSYLFVDFFFLLSGFVMTCAYSDKIRKGFPFKSFLALRLGRLYPLHIFMLLVFVFYTALKLVRYQAGLGGIQGIANNNLSSFLSNLFLIHSIGVHNFLSWNIPSWSISVEFFTYIIFFALIKSVDKNNGVVLPVIIFILGYWYLLSLGGKNLDITYNFGLIRCVAGFYVGVFLFRVSPKLGKWEFNANLAEVSSLIFVIFSVSMAHNGMGYQFLSLASFFVALLVFSNPKSGFIGRVLHSSPLRTIGAWSYSIYMLHSIVHTFYVVTLKYVVKIDPETIAGPRSIVFNIIFVCLVMFFSRFTYIYVEDKFRNLVKSRIM
jgi:peptidoglycan/LPS O-acetylase OafA/YrhL